MTASDTEPSTGNAATSTSVLIVGAGPIGLALATDLGSRGIDCIVLERHASVESVTPKIMHVSVRTMEFCRRLGIADPVRNWGFPVDFPHDTAFVTSMSGYELARIPVPALEAAMPSEYSPEDTCHCPQNWFDPILRRRAGEFPSVAFRYGTRLLTSDQSDEGVVATVLDDASGSTSRIRADYLVACDGYNSTVRAALGIGMSGQDHVDFSVNILFQSDNLRQSHGFGDALRYVLVGPNGTWATLWAVDGRDTWRLTAYGTDGAGIDALDADEVIRDLGCVGLNYEIRSVTRWTRRALVADHMRQGRIFLAGDSAHATPPNGGLGMNTGFADAMNLGWKLAGVIKGWAHPGLLDSYEPERLPVARQAVQEGLRDYGRLTENTQFAGIDEPTERGERIRADLGARLRGENVKAWRPVGIHLGYIYQDSSAVVQDTPGHSFDIEPYEPSTIPGARAPHAWLSSGRSTLDLFGDNYTLLRIGRHGPTAAALLSAATTRSIPVDVYDIDDEAVLSLYQTRLVLVRPDGHVAWRSNDDEFDAELVLDTLSGRRGGVPQSATVHP